MKKGYILSIASVLIMSVTPILNKLTLKEYTPLITSFIFSICSIIFTSLAIRKTKLTKINIRIVLISLLSAFGLCLQFYSLNYLSPATFAFIGRFYIIFTILLSLIMLKEKLSLMDILAIILSIVGTIYIYKDDPQRGNLQGIIYAFLYTFMFAMCGVITKKELKRTSSNTINFYNQLLSIIVIGILIVFTGQNINVNFKGVFVIALSAFASGFVGLLLYYEGMKYLSMSKVSIIRSLSPVVVLFYSVIVFNTKITSHLLIGGFLILFSVIMMNSKDIFQKLIRRH
ncbi:DMT family transporter [Fructilactobacillus cliffordii]|uniref:DMT family transporter n=1 Tax=Fructilactobacillus cliffordii TaxID=2940299 RepID=A0A9Q8ZP20_9LACO|nr:DMT family transporter [Fructilactobacillus cliffordii]USS88960.1 DMT family transporter [Fructilactobacillus cliffordii]